jgi:ABC-type sugar transport system substrate-binding protein
MRARPSFFLACLLPFLLACPFALGLAGCERTTCGEGTRYDEHRDECVAAPAELPVGQASHETDLRVALEAGGGYRLGATPLDEDALRTRVQRRVAAATGPVRVTLAAPAEVPHARVVRTLDRLRAWGVDDIALASPDPGGGPPAE